MVQQVRWLWELHEQLKGLNQRLIGECLASQWEWQLSGSPHQSLAHENQFVRTTPSCRGCPSPPPPPPLLHQHPQIDHQLGLLWAGHWAREFDGISERGGVRETNHVHHYHPTFRKPKFPSLKDNYPHQVFSILESYVIKDLLTILLKLASSLSQAETASNFGKFDFGLAELPL